MNVFYKESCGRVNVPASSPVAHEAGEVLEIFRNLDLHRGFMGLKFNDGKTLQLLPRRRAVRIELVDSTKRTIDSTETDMESAVRLLEVAFEGADVFTVAPQMLGPWERLDF